MRSHSSSPARMASFSDGVMAVVITLMVLELRPPASARLEALVALWPTAVSYAVSYAFIAVIWVNHHYLLRFAKRAEPGLVWLNFAHLFLVSLLPFATAWMATTRLAPVPVAIYAGLFMAVNVAYAAFVQAVVRQADRAAFPEQARRSAQRRSAITITVFAAAMLLALFAPLLAMLLICAALASYVRPDAPRRVARSRRPVFHALAHVEI